MSETLKRKLLALTAARYRQLTTAMTHLIAVQDPLSALLRIHLLTERILEELIRIAFDENAEAILDLELTYRKKLDLAAAVQLDPEYPLVEPIIVGSLRKLNTLRNRLAHSLDATLDNQQVIELFMGVEQLTGDPKDYPIEYNLRQYAFFVLGTMLPKYELIEEGEEDEENDSSPGETEQD